MEEARLIRGREIAASRKVRQASDGHWLVLSQFRPKVKYSVNVQSDWSTCSCPDYANWELPCKHIYAVRFFRNGLIEVPQDEESNVMRPTYTQVWPAYNAAQVNEKDHVKVLLHDLCSKIETPPQKTGRPRLPLGDMVYATTMKVYSTVSGRRASSDIRACKAEGHLDVAPHYNSISNYLGNEALTPILKELIHEVAVPLKELERDFAIDSTGFSTSVYSRWFDHKYGKEKKQQRWLKAHAMVGVKTNIVTSIEVTDGYVSDTTQLPELVKVTAQNFTIGEVSADKAYLSNRNTQAITSAGGTPFILFKQGAKGKGSPSWENMWRMFWFKRDDFEKHYHKRSNVETTFSMIKRKFGGNLRSKDLVAQTNELLCKVLAHNLVVVIHEAYELGITPTVTEPLIRTMTGSEVMP